MAFTLYNWSEVSVSLNQGLVSAAIATPSSDTVTLQGAMNLFSYFSLDAVATINAVDYFLPVVIDLELWDVIIVTGSDASEMIQVTAITKPDDNGAGGSVTTSSFTPTGSVGTANIVNGAVTGIKLAYPLNGVATGFEFDTTTSSATPGTVRSLYGKMSGTGTPITSGNLVGVRGEVDLVSASAGFIYGLQGKVIPTGTLSGSVWAPAIFGQYDLSAATINAGQTAPVWADYGASGGTFTDVTGMRMFSGTNTIASLTLNAMDYRYGKASNLFELAGDAGTYITAGGATASGTIKKIAITIDGVQYYLQAATVYS